MDAGSLYRAFAKYFVIIIDDNETNQTGALAVALGPVFTTEN